MSVTAEHLVVDSGGFIKNDLGTLDAMTDNIVTLHEVVSELRDKDVRQRLRVTPLELTYSSPTSEAVRRVSEFARKTGDFASLSAVDISVLAVTYDLEVAHVGRSHLKTEPTVKKTTQFYHPKQNREKNMKADSKLPGFFDGDEAEEKKDTQLVNPDSFDQYNFWREPVADIIDDPEDEDKVDDTRSETPPHMAPEEVDDDFLVDLNKFLLKRPFLSGFEVTEVDFAVLKLLSEVSLEENLHLNIIRWRQNIETHAIMDSDEIDVNRVKEYVRNEDDFTVEDTHYDDQVEDIADTAETDSNDHGYDSDKENDNNDDDDDDDGWITPGNLKSKKAALNGVSEDAKPERVKVALMTTDFAMQNVCKQMGLNMIGTNGMMIRETKTWILRCYGCFRTTPLMDKKFCPKCGNKTLKRVSVTLNEDGSQQIHISTRRPINIKGSKYSIPAPKGGKHAWNPKLTEDQPEPQQRLSKRAMKKNNPMGEDYIAGNSPFITKDVTSKSAMLGLGGGSKGNAQASGFYWTQRNPNAVRKNTGNRKK